MQDDFTITVTVEDKEYTFEGRLATTGYTHKFYVLINGHEVIYEPDEERNYRATLTDADTSKLKPIDITLIKAVGDKIQAA